MTVARSRSRSLHLSLSTCPKHVNLVRCHFSYFIFILSNAVSITFYFCSPHFRAEIPHFCRTNIRINCHWKFKNCGKEFQRSNFVSFSSRSFEFPVFFRFFILLSSLHSSVGSFVVEFQLKRDGRKKRNKKNALWPSVSNIIVISIIIGQRSENKCVCVFDSKIGQTEKKKQEILTGIKSVKEDEHTSKKGKPDDKSTRYDCWTRLRGICVFCTNTVLFSSFVEHIE